VLGSWLEGGKVGRRGCACEHWDRSVVGVLALGEGRVWKGTVLGRRTGVVARERVCVVFLSDSFFGSDLRDAASRLETAVHHGGSTLLGDWRGSRLRRPR
jgi:hypothetical protein